jgi:hypothetical protein
MVELLLSHNADVNAVDDKGETPLHDESPRGCGWHPAPVRWPLKGVARRYSSTVLAVSALRETLFSDVVL